MPSVIFCDYHSNNQGYSSDIGLDETKLETKIPTKLSKCALLFDDDEVVTVQTADSTKSSNSFDEATNNGQNTLSAGNAEFQFLAENADLPVQSDESTCTDDAPDYCKTLKFCYAESESYYVGESKEQALEVSYMIPTPLKKKPKDRSLTPFTIAVAGTIGTIDSKILLKYY